MVDEKNLNRISAKRYNEHSDYRERNDKHHVSRLRPIKRHSNNANVSVYFDSIEDVICKEIEQHEIAVGAVAWLTNQKILRSLSKCSIASIVIQKEDFLRLDLKSGPSPDFKKRIRESYSKLKPIEWDSFSETYPGQQEDGEHYNGDFQHHLFDASGMLLLSGDAIRCIGYSRQKDVITPFMHHKFIVLGYRAPSLIMYPSKVITGSFNMTVNSTKSRENIVVIEDPKICQAYISEWAQLWGFSEELDWQKSDPFNPDLYVGT